MIKNNKKLFCYTACSILSLLLAFNKAQGIVVATKEINDVKLNIALNGVIDFPIAFINPEKKIADTDVNPIKTVDYQSPVLSSFASLMVVLDAESEYIKGGGSIGLQTSNFSQRAVSTNFYIKNKGPHFAEFRLGSETAMGLKLQADGSIYNSKLAPLQNFLPSNSTAHTYDATPFLGNRDRPGYEKPRMVSIMLGTEMSDVAKLTIGGSYIPDSTNVGSKSHNDLEFKNHPLVNNLKMSITDAYSFGANLEFDISEVKLKLGGLYEMGKVNLFVQNYEFDKVNDLNKKEGNFVRLPSDKNKVNDYKSYGFSASIGHEYFGIGGSYQTMTDSFLIPNLNVSGDNNIITDANKTFLGSGSASNEFYTMSFGGYLAYGAFRAGIKYDKTSNTYSNTFTLTEFSITHKTAEFFTTYARLGFYNTEASYKVDFKTSAIADMLVKASNPDDQKSAIDPKKVSLDLRAYDKVNNPKGLVDFKKLDTPISQKGNIFAIGAIMVF